MNNSKVKSVSSLAILLFLLGISAWLVASFAIYKKPLWGSLLSNFVFFTAATQGAFVIAIGIRIASGKWAAPFLRLAAGINLAFIPFSSILLLVVLLNHGQIHFWAAEPNHNLWYNPIFFVTRNVVFFLTFYILSYRLFKLSKLKGSQVNNDVEHKLILHGFFLILIFVVGMTLFSWDMSMTLNHGYADTVYSFYFIFSAIYGGFALTIILMTLSSKLFDVSFPARTYEYGGQLMLGFTVIWFYLWWSQYFTVWYSHLPEETQVILYRASFNYRSIYLGMMFLAAVIPFLLLLLRRVRNTKSALTTVSIVVLLGLWFERYLQTVPPLVKAGFINYMNALNPVNLLFALALLGGLLVFFLRTAKKNPDVLPSIEKDPNDILIEKPRGW